MKKIFVFGSQQCPDCLVMKDFLTANEVRFSFIDIQESLGKLKMFLKYRDTLAVFEPVRQSGGVGIPLIVADDGAFTTLEGPSEGLLAKLVG